MKKIGLMSAVLVSGAAFAADGIKLGGFADVGFAWTKDADPATRFAAPEGAFYFGKTMGAGEVMVDVPFASIISDDLSNMQAHVSWKYDNGFWWKMGRFDGLYGAEAMDSWDRFFSHAGLLSDATPTAHLGLNLGYKASDSLNVHFLIANAGLVAALPAGAKYDFGFKVESMSDAFNVALGAIFQAAAGTGDYGYLLNVVGSSKMGQLGTTIELVYNKAKDLGVGAHFDYAMSEDTDLGASVEFMKPDVGDSTTELRVGPKFNMTKDFNVRVALGMKFGAVEETTVGLNAVHRF